MSDFFHSHAKYLSSCLKEDEKFLAERRDALSGNINLAELENRRSILELERQKQQQTIELASSDLVGKLSDALHDFLKKEADVEIDNMITRFENDLKQYSDLGDLEAEWETVSERPSRLYTLVRNNLLHELKNEIAAVFKSQDTKLRGKLNSSLKEAGVIALPDISGSFIPVRIQKEINPAESAGKIKEMQDKLDSIDQKLSELSDAEAGFERLKEEKISLQSEISRTQTAADRRMAVLGSRPTAQVITIPGYDEDVDRDGIGYLFQWIIGKKTVHRPPRQRIDTTAQDQFDSEIKSIEKWRQDKEEVLNHKLEELREQYTEAQIANRRRIEMEKIRIKTESKKQELENQLKEELAAARKKALAQNKRNLKNALSESLRQLRTDLQQTTDKCSEWAEKYISGIRAEVDDFLRTRGAELASLEKEINMKKDQKKKALKQLEEFEKDQQVLQQQFDRISRNINNIYK